MTFEQIDSKVDIPSLEREILEFWKDNKIFEKRVEMQAGRQPWCFIDGPITANNPMGVHHAWGRTGRPWYPATVPRRAIARA